MSSSVSLHFTQDRWSSYPHSITSCPTNTTTRYPPSSTKPQQHFTTLSHTCSPTHQHGQSSTPNLYILLRPRALTHPVNPHSLTDRLVHPHSLNHFTFSISLVLVQCSYRGLPRCKKYSKKCKSLHSPERPTSAKDKQANSKNEINSKFSLIPTNMMPKKLQYTIFIRDLDFACLSPCVKLWTS